MVLFLRFLANVAKCISKKQEDQCMKGSKNLLVPNPPRFRNTLTRPGTFQFWNEVKFTDRQLHWHTCRVKKAIQHSS